MIQSGAIAVQSNKSWYHIQYFSDNSRTCLIARFMGPTWGPPGADRTHVGPMWATWALLSGISLTLNSQNTSPIKGELWVSIIGCVIMITASHFVIFDMPLFGCSKTIKLTIPINVKYKTMHCKAKLQKCFQRENYQFTITLIPSTAWHSFQSKWQIIFWFIYFQSHTLLLSFVA